MSDNIDKINFGTERFSLDSSVVIAFFNSNLEYILRGIFKTKVYFSSEIFKEIKIYNLNSFNYHILGIKKIKESEYFYHLSSKHISFSVVDVQLITICKFNDLVCVSFEKKMRKVCKEEKVKSIGLLHILREAIESKLIDKIKAKEIILKLKRDGLYIDNEIYNEILIKFNKFN